jgi:hypothetical protein
MSVSMRQYGSTRSSIFVPLSFAPAGDQCVRLPVLYSSVIESQGKLLTLVFTYAHIC